MRKILVFVMIVCLSIGVGLGCKSTGPIGPTVPAAPALSSPTNNSTGVATTLDLSWGTVSGATSYNVQLSTAQDFAAISGSQSVTGTTTQAVDLGAGTIYYWRISAENVSGTGLWSATWSFTTVAPAAPALSSPKNNSTGVATTLYLSWGAVSGATSYNVQLSTAHDFAAISGSQSVTGTTTQEPDLGAGTIYYWRISAKNASGTGLWSATWSFTTASGSALDPNAGALASHPGNNAVVTDSVTAGTVGSDVQSNAFSAASKAMALQGSPKMLAATGTGGNINGTINGTNSGTAAATGSYTVNQTTGAVHYDFTLTFSNYSEDGTLFLGGQMHFVYDVIVNMTTYESTGTYNIIGDIRFNGSYVGTNNFTYTINVNGQTQTWTYTSTIVSNGQTITFSRNSSMT